MTVTISSFAKSRMRLLSVSDVHAIESIIQEFEQGCTIDFISNSSAKNWVVLDQQDEIIVHLNSYYLCFNKTVYGYDFISIVKEDEVLAV